MPAHKYGAKAVVIDGKRFASKAESRRFLGLQLLERAGHIRDLELQPSFVIAPAVELDGKKKRARRYVADFRYTEVATGRNIVEDVKGFATEAYKLKRHLVKALHGIEVREIR